MIKAISTEDDFHIYAVLLNDSFATVADEFGLTKENCPSNNAFITEEQLRSQLTEKERMFFYFEENDTIIGFVAIEKSSSNHCLFYIEKLAVHPDFRKKGIGKKLMDFAIHRIKELGGKEISIGLIDSNNMLKKWYKEQGFVETGTKSFDHLPFDVCMMSKSLL